MFSASTRAGNGGKVGPSIACAAGLSSPHSGRRARFLLAIRQHRCRRLQARRAGIHRATWDRIRSSGSSDWRRTLASKVGAAGGEPAGLQHLVIGQRHLRHIVRETGRCPARLIVVPVHVDRPEDARAAAVASSCSKEMAGQDRVALFDVDLHLALKAKVLEEPINRGHIVIILVFGRLLRLGLDQDRAPEPILCL